MKLRLLDHSWQKVGEADASFTKDFNGRFVLFGLFKNFGATEHSFQLFLVVLFTCGNNVVEELD
jgi:hypothetical protein